jgi:ABC-2 type transport system ATP-binding protein
MSLVEQVQTAGVATATATSYAIYTENLTKTYGSSRGIVDINLQVAEGEVFGFLGPNGAGKTTTIRVLLNLIKPSKGRALINGLDAQNDSVQIKKQIGYLPGEFTLYPNLTGAQTLQYFANLRGGVDWNYVTSLATRLELDLTKRFKQYSRGNKQKVGIIQALMHKPRLLILDEPTGGLDPLNQEVFYKMVQEVQAEGRTVFFSSHILGEVEKTCNRIGIVRDGHLVNVSSISELTGLKTHSLELTFSGDVAVEQFNALAGVSKLEKEVNADRTILRCMVQADKLDEVIKLAAHYPILNFVSREPSLEEVFLEYYREPGQVS